MIEPRGIVVQQAAPEPALSEVEGMGFHTAKNRRVDIRLMTNTGAGTTPAQAPTNQTPTASANPPSS